MASKQGRIRADRGSEFGKSSRKPGGVIRLTRSRYGWGVTWLTLDEARLLLGELQQVVRAIETEQTVQREAERETRAS